MGLRWKGDKVKRNARTASIIGINRTMSEAVGQAKGNHPWQNRSVTLEPGIKIAEGAAVRGGKVSGTWGVPLVNYAQYLERSKKWRWLVPAARAIYPRLKHHIKVALGG